MPRTLQSIVSDLHALLTHAGIPGLFGPRLWPRYVQLLNYPGIPLDKQSGFETVDIDGAIKAVQHARPLPRVPLAVISKTEPFATAPGAPKSVSTKLDQVWPAVQRALVALEPQTPHVFAIGSDHYVQIHDPDLAISIIGLNPRPRSVPRTPLAPSSQRFSDRHLVG